MEVKELILQRFTELEKQMNDLREVPAGTTGLTWYPQDAWQAWATSVANLFDGAFGRTSVHFETFERLHQNRKSNSDVDAAKGVFRAAKADFEGGYVFNLERAVIGEVFGDFVVLAKEALANGNHIAAAVLASAALEDALKRFASSRGVDILGKTMQEVVNSLKAKGFVAGAQKSLLDAMPKVRNQAMHADWTKLTASDAASVIGFVEQFLIANF